MYKVTSKIRFDVSLWKGGGFMKNVAVTFSVPKSFDEWFFNFCEIIVIRNWRNIRF